MTMEGLYKVGNVIGKGLGWIALQDIKAGTLIYKEKPQFVYQKETPINDQGALELMKSYYAMTENDQKEFLELHNLYLDLNSLTDSEKKWYFDTKTDAEAMQRLGYDIKLLLKIICITDSNAFKGAVRIKVSRINHSCCPNSLRYKDEDEMVIRATSKILEGQEITVSYMQSYMEMNPMSKEGFAMRNFKERQEFCHTFGFVCSCELCQDEEFNKDDETYEKFQNLKEEVESIIKQRSFPGFPLLEKALVCQKQMFNLAKKKKATKVFLHEILGKAFDIGYTGYLEAFDQKNHGKMKYFKGECENLSKAGFKIAKMCFGSENAQQYAKLKEWKEINQDFDNWVKKKIEKEFGKTN